METAKCDHFVTDRNWYYKLNVNTIGGVTLNVITFIGFHCSWIMIFFLYYDDTKVVFWKSRIFKFSCTYYEFLCKK